MTLQVLTGALRAACEEMGAVLIRSAHSANIKERRDCSTALFDARGELVMQAEHIPVHLGSMPDAVAAVIGEEHSDGDVWILNDPYQGGTHLPDITLVSPIFAGSSASRPGPASAELIGFRGCACAPRRRRRRDAGRDAGLLHQARPGGRGDPADPGRRRAPARAGRPHAEPVPAARRPPGPAGREPDRDRADAGAGRAPGPRGPAGRHGRDPRLRGAAHALRPRGAAGRRGRAPRTCWRRRTATWRCG